MTHLHRTIAAFVLAPAVVAAGAGFLFQPSQPIGVILFALPITYAHAIILGVPIFLWCRRKSWFGISAVLLAAFLIGALPVGVWLMFAPAADYYRAGSDVLVENGTLTSAGIWAYAQIALSAGGFGVTAGIVWLLVAGKSANPLL